MVALRCGFGAPTPVAEIAGGAGIVAGAAALAWAAARCARQRDAPLPAVVALFLGTSLLYAANTAVGRVRWSPETGQVGSLSPNQKHDPENVHETTSA
jgi:hypothetical protein